MSEHSVRIDHDRLFKELIETFFAEFMELFFPDIYSLVELDNLHFLKEEIFTDVTAGEKHYIDLLVETKLKGEASIILIHVESQAQYQSHFAERMFIYFSRLYQKYRHRILPIAIFSYDEIHNEPNNFQINFPFMKVLEFNYHIIELKKKPWRDYITNDNPVAAALLSKMGYNENEKVQVKLEFLRMLTRMEYDPARMVLLTGFFETYLKLNPEEEKSLETAISNLTPKEVDKMLEMTTSWHEKGRVEGWQEGKQEGRQEGQTAIILRQLTKKYGSLPEAMMSQIKNLNDNNLTNLGEAILDFNTIGEIKEWLNKVNHIV